MRFSSILSEAWRNIAFGPARLALISLVFAAGTGAVAVADERAVVSVVSDTRSYVASGGTVNILESPAVDGRGCDELGGDTGVRAAGALRAGAPIRALKLPSVDLTVWEVTPGFLDVLKTAAAARGDAHAEGVWLSSDLARSLGLAPGDALESTSGPIRVAGVYIWPEDGRRRDLGYAVVSPVSPTKDFEQCWAEVWPVGGSGLQLLFTSASTSDASKIGIGRLNEDLGSKFMPQRAFSARITGGAPLAAGLIGMLVALGAIRLRRLELASAMHAGVCKSDMFVQQTVEAAAWIFVGGILAAGACLMAETLGNPTPDDTIWLIGLRSVGCGGLAGLLGTILGVALVKENQLFRYFKDR